MSSVVDICNLALAHLGDRATLSSIDPPEGSAQADHCAQFWPIVRDEALTDNDWKFARALTSPTRLADDAHEDPSWYYSYAQPADFLVARAMSYGENGALTALYPGSPLFDMSTLENGTPILLANEQDLNLVYTRRVSDPSKYPAKFVTAVSYLLASYLAGPVIKGKTAVQMAQTMRVAYERLVGKAALTDANQNNIRNTFTPAGIRARGARGLTTVERGDYRYELPFWAEG